MKKLIGTGTHAALLAGAVLAVVAVAMSARPTMAAKGGRHAAQLTSTIVLDPTSDAPHLGGTVTFTTDAALEGGEWAMVGITCTQSGTVVYGALDTPDATFLLGGNSSLWLQRGGSADCVATLYAYAWKSVETIRSLATTSFAAAGS